MQIVPFSRDAQIDGALGNFATLVYSNEYIFRHTSALIYEFGKANILAWLVLMRVDNI